MKFNGIDLKEVIEQQIFNPPKKMLVWNNTMDYAVLSLVVAIVERMDGLCAMCYDGETFPHCAEIPDVQKPRRATNRNLSQWLAKGLGEVRRTDSNIAFTNYSYDIRKANDELPDELLIKKWGDNYWHEPTEDYIDLED